MEVLKRLRLGRIERKALQSRFGKRLLLLFVGLALLPIFTLAVVTYTSVTGELHEQRDERLREQTKSQGMAILERLALLDGELALVASTVASGAPGGIPDALAEPLAERFTSLAWNDGEAVTVLHGSPPPQPELKVDQWAHLLEGRSLLLLGSDTGGARLGMVRLIQLPGSVAPGVVWSEIDPSYLWWGRQKENHLPAYTELCFVRPATGSTLFCSSGAAADLSADQRAAMTENAFGVMSWTRGGVPHQAHYRSMVLAEKYLAPNVAVVQSESEERLGRPLREFRISFVPIVLVTLWIVLLLSLRQIRSNLVPLERLRAGTRAIADQEFSTRVTVKSGDEFEELAASFNRMAGRLGRQFESMNALNQIQSDVLSAADRLEIASAALTRLDHLMPCCRAQLTVLSAKERSVATAYVWRGQDRAEAVPLEIDSEDLWWIEHTQEIRLVEDARSLPAFLAPLEPDAELPLAVVPVLLTGSVIGVLVAVLADRSALHFDDLGSVRQLSDQLAQALSKAKVIEDLEELSHGTLAALARTIDANSKWTLGHSERVTELAVSLGRKLGLSKEELDTLRRGALLHDIGKLGVPSSVIDKPSKLTPEEMALVRSHVEIGWGIVEPVPSLADTLPLVRHHHEWIDGSGYPDGLAGDQIHPLAKLLAVVDVYDALRSERPYRAAVERAEVVRYMKKQAGVQFDPDLVDAFLELLVERDDTSEVRPSPSSAGAP